MASLSSVSLHRGQKGQSDFTPFYFITSLGAPVWGCLTYLALPWVKVPRHPMAVV